MNENCEARKIHIVEVGRNAGGEPGYHILDQFDQSRMVFVPGGWLIVYSQATPAVVAVREYDGKPEGERGDAPRPEEGDIMEIGRDLKPLHVPVPATPRMMQLSFAPCEGNPKDCINMMRHGPIIVVSEVWSHELTRPA